MYFQGTIKLNNILETRRTKSAFCLSKLGAASQRLIRLEFHTCSCKGTGSLEAFQNWQ